MNSGIKKALKYATNPHSWFGLLARSGWFKKMSDEDFITKMFNHRMNYSLNLDNPKTFNEKLQWLKLHDRKPIYSTMVDKMDVKKYVADIIGSQYVIPLLGVWEKFEDIDFSVLPNQFVLKCTHDSGGLVICRNKSEFNYNAAKKKIKRCLRHNWYYAGREWPYKGLKPRIIAEKYMGNNLTDYKFLCFEGIPKLIEIHRNRGTNSYTQDFYTLDWKKSEITQGKRYEGVIPKPKNFDLMVKLSRILATDIHHIRVDWYEIEGELYFGELTFFDGSGFMPFDKKEYDEYLGSLIKI